ncbi:MAG: Crp/Fnr family transcriptional regulator [Rhizobiales bacterium]|nr:Crp/Fnr family transcriptional regulator [Hyphomicrobiales bacterium]
MIKSFLKQFEISTNDQDFIISKLRPIRFSKGNILEDPNNENIDQNRFIYFIKQGILRVYHMHNDNEINTYFSGSDDFISSFGDIIGHNKTTQYIAAIEDGVAFKLNAKDYKDAYINIDGWEKVGRHFAESNYICISDRYINFNHLTGKEKYIKFCHDYTPEMVKNIPNYHIASYLGLTAESLSRIKFQLKP